MNIGLVAHSAQKTEVQNIPLHTEGILYGITCGATETTGG